MMFHTKFTSEFPYCHPREIYAYHFQRLWDKRNTSVVARDSLRQNIKAQRRHNPRVPRNPKS